MTICSKQSNLVIAFIRPIKYNSLKYARIKKGNYYSNLFLSFFILFTNRAYAKLSTPHILSFEYEHLDNTSV